MVAVLFTSAFLLGCVTPPVTPPIIDTPCTTMACFISSANACNATNLTVTEDYGVINYATSANCTLTKTIIRLDANETQQMKALLEGKSMICSYENGKFDTDLVNTMVFGIENCIGELSDNLRILIVFATD